MLHYLIKYLENSLNHKRAEYMFPYTEFTNRTKYSSRNYFVIITSSTMPSGHSMNTSTGISGCINAASVSHSLCSHPSSSWNKVSTIRISVDVSVVTRKNDSM